MHFSTDEKICIRSFENVPSGKRTRNARGTFFNVTCATKTRDFEYELFEKPFNGVHFSPPEVELRFHGSCLPCYVARNSLFAINCLPFSGARVRTRGADGIREHGVTCEFPIRFCVSRFI